MIESPPPPALPTIPSVTVITVCRNALADLRKTTESIRRQTHERIEHVVVDGGSTDGTVFWLNEHRQQFAVAESEPDNGIYDAMNKALKLSPDSDWIIFLNAGDVFHDEETVRRTLPLLRRLDVDFVFGDVCITDAANTDVSRTYPLRRSARLEMPGCHQSCFVRASLMKRLRFDLAYKVAGDFECWLRATRQNGSKTAFADHVIATIAPEGFSARNEPTLQREYTQAIRTHVNALAAGWWLLKRKARNIATKLRPSPVSKIA